MTFLRIQPPLLSSYTPKQRLTIGILSFCSLPGRRHWREQRGSGILTAGCGLRGTCAYFCLPSRCPASPYSTGLLLCLPRKKLELREVKPFFEKEKKNGTRFQNQVCLTQWPQVDSFSSTPCCLTRKLQASLDTYIYVTSLLFPLSQGVILKWLRDKRTSCGGFIKNKYPQFVLLSSSLS